MYTIRKSGTYTVCFPDTGFLYGICIASDAQLTIAGLLSQKLANVVSQLDLQYGAYLPTYFSGFFTV